MLTQSKRLALYCDILYKSHTAIVLSTEQVSCLLNTSTVTLGRWRRDGIGPIYKQDQDGPSNATVTYPIDTIAEFVISNNVITTMELPNA